MEILVIKKQIPFLIKILIEMKGKERKEDQNCYARTAKF